MRDLDWIYAVRDRVLAEIKANPPRGPLLVESRRSGTCKRGHVGGIVERKGHRFCAECERERKRRKA
jgi:hypothetical protein